MDKIYGISLNCQVLHLQVGPSHCLIISMKLFRFSDDFNSFGKQFHILGPMALRLLEQRVT